MLHCMQHVQHASNKSTNSSTIVGVRDRQDREDRNDRKDSRMDPHIGMSVITNSTQSELDMLDYSPDPDERTLLTNVNCGSSIKLNRRRRSQEYLDGEDDNGEDDDNDNRDGNIYLIKRYKRCSKGICGASVHLLLWKILHIIWCAWFGSGDRIVHHFHSGVLGIQFLEWRGIVGWGKWRWWCG